MAKGKKNVGTSKAAKAARVAKFIAEYMRNGENATQAYKAAGFTAKNDNVAAANACLLVKDHKVAAELDRWRREGLAKAKLTADEVMASLARDLRFDPATMFGADGKLLKVDQMPYETRMALRGAEITEVKAGSGEDALVIGYTSKVKFPEKTSARDQAMKHYGLYERDNEQKPAAVVHLPGVKSVKFEPLRARKAA